MSRPLSARQAGPYVRQGPVPSFNRQKPVTKEEIEDLKRQKLLLLEEKKQLKTRIARMQVQNRRGGKPVTTNKQLHDQLEKEYTTLEKMIDKQQRKVAELTLSDSAALCLELQEECKIILQERMRLQDEQLNQQMLLNESQQELDELVASEGPEMLEKQNERIMQLEAKLARYHHANKKLKAKIQSIRSERAYTEEANNEEVEKRAEELRKQIQEIRSAIAKNEEKYQESEANHEALMNRLKAAVYGESKTE